MELSQPLKDIIGRCTSPAWNRLRQLSGDPIFDILLEVLQHVEGSITELQIEQLYRQLATEPRPLIQYGSENRRLH